MEGICCALRGCSLGVSWVFRMYFVAFVALSQSVSNVLAIRQQHYGRPSAAVGADLSCPHIWIHPRNGKRKCVCGDLDTHIWLCEYVYLVMQGHGRDESVPYAWRNVRNVFILCILHIRYAKVWFLRHKSMVFGVQKPPFYIAKTPFLKCKNGVLNLEHIRQYKNTECFLLPHKWAVDM